jgi:hypothetical protein
MIWKEPPNCLGLLIAAAVPTAAATDAYYYQQKFLSFSWGLL